MLEVEVSGLSGEVLNLLVKQPNPKDTKPMQIEEIKLSVEEAWEIPCRFQKLFSGLEELHCIPFDAPAPLSLSLVISAEVFQEACIQFKEDSSDGKEDVLRDLERWGRMRGLSLEVLTAVVLCLEDDDTNLKMTAMRALLAVAETSGFLFDEFDTPPWKNTTFRTGPKTTLLQVVLVSCWGSQFEGVFYDMIQDTARLLLSKIAELADKDIITNVLICNLWKLWGPTLQLFKEIAADVLFAKITIQEQADVINALIHVLDTEPIKERAIGSGTGKEDIRKNVMVFLDLPKVAEMGDRDVIMPAMIRVLEEDKTGWMRYKAVEVFSRVTKGDQASIEILTKRLNDESACIRERAVRALGEIAGESDYDTQKSIIQNLSPCQMDGDDRVRMAAVKALALPMTAEIDGKDVIIMQSIRNLKNESCIQVWETSMDLFAVIAKGDRVVIDALIFGLTDENTSVRIAIVKILGKLATRRPDQALEPHTTVHGRCTYQLIKNIVIRRLKDENAHVRVAAVEALEMLTERPDNVIKDTLLLLLIDSDASVRMVAVEVLGKLAGKNDNAISSAISHHIHWDPSFAVRTTAVKALAKIRSKLLEWDGSEDIQYLSDFGESYKTTRA